MKDIKTLVLATIGFGAIFANAQAAIDANNSFNVPSDSTDASQLKQFQYLEECTRYKIDYS
ncbi:hypothetical protein N5853_05070 [Bartonella sp. HY329]|uniref:hypothetical protein n=1 Tax=unclassified Bartonella TaxID=2645622 RepID=UPI0021C7FEDE|nr:MULTISPECIES: hypothetical protein [unclassified Bartonella]UXM95995.1 hypothetical protein N5853_05070 [Bartonella sp. HY329]UXN10320.1 hypothetical protein N5852_05080 [Bartonella sp. HY328]